MRYLSLNAWLGRPGLYRFDPISRSEAQAWLDDSYVSLVNSQEMADQVESVVDRLVPVTPPSPFVLEPGDEALVVQFPKRSEQGMPARLSLLTHLHVPAGSSELSGPELVKETLALSAISHQRLILRAVRLWSHGYYWYSGSDAGEAATALDWLSAGSYTLHILPLVVEQLAEQLALPSSVREQMLACAEGGLCLHRLVMDIGDQALVLHAGRPTGGGYYLRLLTKLDDAVAATCEMVVRARTASRR